MLKCIWSVSSTRALGSVACSSLSSLLQPHAVEVTQIRGRKRALKATLTKAQKLERRLKREEREAARKQYTFMERIKIRRMKNLLSPSQQYPGRYEAEKETELSGRPATNVYIRNMLKTQFLTVSEALAKHRDLQHPMIYNNPNAPIRMRLELNMTTEKTTKMMSNSDEIVPVPFPFKHNEKRTILAFTNDPAMQEAVVEWGAEMAVGQDVVKKILKGHFRTEDYDFCVAHSDMAHAILPLRGVLRTRFPTKFNGGLGDDLKEIIERFRSGVKLAIKSDVVYPIWGLTDCVVGRLSMADEEIEANVETIIKAACSHRNPALGPFINRAVLMTIPGKEFYPIDVNKWLPEPTEEEIERVEKRKTKKAAKKVVERKPSEEDEEGEKKPTAETAEEDDEDDDDRRKSVTA
ncbi:hypothetical protein WR25_03282 [Diploscapter pachys]|uniref:Ribosomal protein L1 n=1 Tax=Diploscapter pachys TaxID=2018661 RepID=A0A2A2JQK5_9BILA|nr:hypothetical protein WR25_03282 [Diploscapter pachys]